AKHPCIPVRHGSGGLGQRTRPIFRGVATDLARKGYCVPIPHLFDSGGDTKAYTEAVRNAVEFAAARRDVDPDRVGLFDFSMGAYSAFYQAARDPRVKAVASCSGSRPLGSRPRFT